jgi:hypothetical protein
MALNLKLKDFDYKQFFLQRGEWIGLGVVLLIVLPVMTSGLIKAFSAGSPAGKARDFNALTKSAEARIAASVPPKDADKMPTEFDKSLELAKVNPEPYHQERPFFVNSEIEDTKRRRPDIYGPEEFDVQAILASVPGAVIQKGANGKEQVLVLQQKDVDPTAKFRGRNRAVRGSFGGRGEGAVGAQQAGVSLRQTGVGMAARWALKSAVAEYLDLDKVQDNTHLAQAVYPVRMVVVSASFPLKEQLREFQKKLRKRSLSELSAMVSNGEAIWGFRKPEIERKTITPDGKESGWEPYTTEIVDASNFYLGRAGRTAPEDERMVKHVGVINNGLSWARLPLARGGYPPANLPLLKAAMDKLDAESKPDSRKRTFSPRSRQLRSQGIDPSNPDPFGTGEDTEKDKEATGQEKPQEAESQAAEGDDLTVPEYALVRFIDATVESGYTYQYRIKIRMANPNFGQHNLAYPALGKDEVLAARDFEQTKRITVPSDTDWYVMDEKPNKDRLTVQIHRWVDFAYTSAEEPDSKTTIGDWTIWERADAHRGEYIGRWYNCELPTWKLEKEKFELAVNTKTQTKKLPVDFAARTGKSQDPALLLDYSGGKGAAIQVQTAGKKVAEDLPVEALVLTPDGKLVIRRQEEKPDPERLARLNDWKEWLFEVKNGVSVKAAQDILNRRAMPGREGGGRRGF